MSPWARTDMSQSPASALKEKKAYLPTMEFRVLGPVEVVVDGSAVPLGGPKQRALLGLLVSAAPNLVTVDVLLDGLWGERVSTGSRSTLQTYVSNLRQLLGDVVQHDRGGYRLDVDLIAIDAVAFSRALEESRAKSATDPEGVAVDLRRVLALWRGRPYADLIDVPGLDPEIRRLESLRLEAVELRVDAELAVGRHVELVAELEALAEEHPTRERFRAQHMLALYRAGRQADALRAYRRTESYLAEELGVDPSKELQDLELKILEHNDSLLTGVAREVTQRLAFLVTDIEGSTRLWDQNPESMAKALATHDLILREQVMEAGGRVFKHTGDGILAVFPNSVSAVTAAESVLTRLARTDWGDVGELRVRMGIDVGEAETRGDDFFGPPLNRAARLCAIGHGGQVLVSSAAEREVTASAPAGLQVRHLGEVHLRGMATPDRVAQMVFVGLPADFPDLRLDAGSPLDQRVEMVSLPGYEVRDRLGEGGFGVVWRAYQPSVGREVAIKVIRPELASQPAFVRRFEAEARTIARLAHPHIVPLIDFWRDTAGAYLVLGLLPGGSLDGLLATEQIDIAVARRILGHVGSALDHAHSQGVVHGDLKPANILLDGSGNAYLSDFGIATRLLDPQLVVSASSAPEYRAPEEFTSGPSRETDLFALGILGRRLLGERAEVEAVLARATARNPEDRYDSAEAFLAELDELLEIHIDQLAHFPVSRNPYKGLRPFDEGDATDFFGRDDLVAAIIAALSLNRFVTVVGPSGSGKSSVVRSGLLPTLADNGSESDASWLPVVFTPGSSPLDALVEALTRSTAAASGDEILDSGLAAWAENAFEGNLLLVIDQFEEVYTAVDDAEERQRFFDVIVDAVTGPGRIHVVATLRADFYDRPLADVRMGRLVRDGQVTVLAPSREELIEMIASPAQAVGLRWEPGLPHRIAEDVAHQPGGLPLLQYALTELVERRGGDLLTASDYTRVGEVAGALAHRAESLYQGFDPSQQEAARQVLLRLVTVDEETDDTRRRVRRGELESLAIAQADLDWVLDHFTRERLLLADRDPVARTPTIEVAHEALLREWPRLRGWIEDQREALILGRRFRAALDDWEVNRRHDDYLLVGNRLAPFMGWAESSSLTPDERTYLQASREKDQEQRAARRRRRRVLTSILAFSTAVAVVLGTIALITAGRAENEAERARAAESRAEQEAERATAEASRARAGELAASAANALDTDPSLAKLLALTSAMTHEPTIDTLSVLHRSWAVDRVVARYSWPESEDPPGVLWTDLSPDGSRLVASGTEGPPSTYLEVFDLESAETVWSYRVDDPTILIDRPIYSLDGGTTVAGLLVPPGNPESRPSADELGAFVWDADTGELLHRFELGTCGGSVRDISDTHLLATSIGQKEDGSCAEYPGVTLMLIDLESFEQQVLTSAVRWHGFLSGDGRYVAYEDQSDPDLEVSVVVDLETGDPVLEYDPFEHEGVGFGWIRDLNHDGSLLLAGDRPMVVWDVAAGEIISRFDGHAGEAFYASFSAPGDSVISSGRDGTLRRWDARTGEEIAVFEAVGAGNVSEGGNDRLLVAEPLTRTGRLIETNPARAEVWGISTCGGFVFSNTLSVTGEHGALSELCSNGMTETQIIHLASRELALTVPGHHGQNLSLSPDGTMFLRQENPCFIPEAEDALPVFCLDKDGEFVGGDFLGPPRIRRIVDGGIVTELEGVCVLDNSFAGDPVDYGACEAYPETPFAMWAWDAAWSNDSNFVAIANLATRAVTAWDVGSGELVGGYDGCGATGVHSVVFTPDDSEVVIYCTDEGRMVSVSTETWDVQREVVLPQTEEAADRRSAVGYTADGSEMVVVGGSAGIGGGSLHWLDAGSLEDTHSVERATERTPKSWAMSPSGSLVAVGASDGFIKVWDVESRAQVHEVYIGETQVQGLAFIDDLRLAVAPQEGGFHVYTLDVSELLEIVRASLTRGFTPAECDRFGFGDDCPTFAELTAG